MTLFLVFILCQSILNHIYSQCLTTADPFYSAVFHRYSNLIIIISNNTLICSLLTLTTTFEVIGLIKPYTINKYKIKTRIRYLEPLN